MSNLTEKLDELQLQMLNQHQQVMQALGIIAAALGSSPPTGPGFAEVVAAISLQTEVLQDVHLDTISIDQKLLAIRDNVVGLLTNTNDLKVIVSAEAEDIGLIQATVGVKAPGAEFSLASLTRALSTGVGNLVTSTGLLAEPAEGTILDLLTDANTIAGDCCGDGGPNNGSCDEPYESEGIVILPWSLIGGTSVAFAVFDEPAPDGITFGETFGLTVDYTELVSADWSQWWIYVTSDQATYADGEGAFARFPTGQWRRLEGSGSRAFSVDARGSITATLCPVGEFNEGGGPAPEPADCCEVSEVEAAGHWVLGPNGTATEPNYQGGVFWFTGNDVDNGSVEIRVGGTLYATVPLVAGYTSTCIGQLPTGTLTLTHVGTGYADTYLGRCPLPS